MRTSHGMILGEGGEKMSKSRGNVINPDDIVAEYGADTFRLYEMFIGDFEKAAPWSSNSIKGCKRFCDRTWALLDMVQEGTEYSEKNKREIHKAIKKVTDDILNLRFNTAIATLMGLLNTFYDNGINKAELDTFLKLANPFAPHITEEMNELLGGTEMLAHAKFPVHDDALTVDESVKVAVQVNGKVRSVIELPFDCDEEKAKEIAFNDQKVINFLEGKNVVKTIVVKNKIVNIVAK